jgi:hypothetical protein
MSDGAAAAGGVWFVLVGLAWVFIIFRPRLKRLRAQYGWPPKQAPMGEQLRFVAEIIAGGLAVTVALFALLALEPILAFLIGPLLFYGYLTVVLLGAERQVRNASTP